MERVAIRDEGRATPRDMRRGRSYPTRAWPGRRDLAVVSNRIGRLLQMEIRQLASAWSVSF